MTATWVLLAVALALLPVRSSVVRPGPIHGAGSDSGAARGARTPLLSRPTSRWVAVAVLGTAAPAVLGLRTGVVTDVIALPLVWLLLQVAGRRRVDVPAAELARLPFQLDLLAAVLTAGFPLEHALTIVAPSPGTWVGDELRQVAGLLRLGATPADAWLRIRAEPRLRAVAVAAVRSAESGIRLAKGFSEVAAELRAQARAEAVARAERVGVWVLAPLGLCFLPAFVCLGIVPTIIGIARTLLAGGL